MKVMEVRHRPGAFLAFITYITCVTFITVAPSAIAS
jgi:hypothetical protein